MEGERSSRRGHTSTEHPKPGGIQGESGITAKDSLHISGEILRSRRIPCILDPASDFSDGQRPLRFRTNAARQGDGGATFFLRKCRNDCLL